MSSETRRKTETRFLRAVTRDASETSAELGPAERILGGKEQPLPMTRCRLEMRIASS